MCKSTGPDHLSTVAGALRAGTWRLSAALKALASSSVLVVQPDLRAYNPSLADDLRIVDVGDQRNSLWGNGCVAGRRRGQGVIVTDVEAEKVPPRSSDRDGGCPVPAVFRRCESSS